jgi:hypothetical protein
MGWARQCGAGKCGREGRLHVGGRGCASGAGALIEVEVRDGFGFGQVVSGRLVEVEIGIGVEGEIVLRGSAREGEERRGGGQAEVG